MQSPAIAQPPKFTGTKEYPARSLSNDRAELAEAPRGPSHAARGAVVGILLGASLWAAILVFVGVIKL
jgi:hypothetical protein